MDIIITHPIASFFAFGFDSLNTLYTKMKMKMKKMNKMKMKKIKNLMVNMINLFFINLINIIINFKFLKNIIFKKINVFILKKYTYILGCQSFYLFFPKFKSFKNLFEKLIGWEILLELEKKSLEIGIELGYENNFNLDSLVVSFASPSQEDNNEISESGTDNGYGSEVYEDEEKVYEENYIPNKSIDKVYEEKENNTQLEENNTRENNKTEIIDEDISNNNSVDIEEGFVGKLNRNFGFDNLASLWNQNSNKNSSSSTSNNDESSTSESNVNVNPSSSYISNNNENNNSSSINTNNNNSQGRFYIDDDNDSDFGDFGDE